MFFHNEGTMTQPHEKIINKGVLMAIFKKWNCALIVTENHNTILSGWARKGVAAGILPPVVGNRNHSPENLLCGEKFLLRA